MQLLSLVALDGLRFLERQELQLASELRLIQEYLTINIQFILELLLDRVLVDPDYDLGLSLDSLLELEELVGRQPFVLQLDVEENQMYEEQQSQSVEDDHHNQRHEELGAQLHGVNIDKVLLDVLALRQKVVDDKSVSNVVHQAHPKDPDYQLEELIVILFTNAVVEVPAVVVEAGGAPVALSAVLGACEHVGIADLAVILVLGRVKGYTLLLACLFQVNSGILGIDLRASVPVVSCTSGK